MQSVDMQDGDGDTSPRFYCTGTVPCSLPPCQAGLAPAWPCLCMACPALGKPHDCWGELDTISSATHQLRVMALGWDEPPAAACASRVPGLGSRTRASCLGVIGPTLRRPELLTALGISRARGCRSTQQAGEDLARTPAQEPSAWGNRCRGPAEPDVPSHPSGPHPAPTRGAGSQVSITSSVVSSSSTDRVRSYVSSATSQPAGQCPAPGQGPGWKDLVP